MIDHHRKRRPTNGGQRPVQRYLESVAGVGSAKCRSCLIGSSPRQACYACQAKGKCDAYHNDFNELRHAATAMRPEQAAATTSWTNWQVDAAKAQQRRARSDRLLGLWRDYADEMDEIVADAYRKRRAEPWRGFDL